MENIFDYVRSQKHEYQTRFIPLTEGDEYSQYETIKQVDYYWRNKYLEDASDDIIGDYPFDNISKFRVLLEARATDFDVKHIEIEPKDADRVTKVRAMVATKGAQAYMRKSKFGVFINDLCITRPKFGGVLCKRTEDGVHVIPWENLITDQSDVMKGIRIERHYMTPSELLKMKSWKNVKKAIRTAAEWRDKGMGDYSDQAETQGHLIQVYEIQGDLPLSLLKQAEALRDDKDWLPKDDDEDDYTYVEAKIILCGADWVESKTDDLGQTYNEYGGLVLYAEKEKTNHKYLARNPITGRGLGEGVVESLFEHQKWHNFTKTEEMRMIAIAGKKLYWTDDPDVLANIFDDGVDHGTVLRVSPGKTFQELNQMPTGLPTYQLIRQEWEASADKTTSSFNAKIGEEAKSGTPFRAQYLQNVEASSQFEQYREEIGFLLKEIVEDWILPDALADLDTKDEIYATFTPQELQLIDEAIVTQHVNHALFEKTMESKVVTPEELEMIRMDAMAELQRNGSKRQITKLGKLKDFIKDAGGSVVVHTTDEARNKAVYFESLANALALFQPGDPRRTALENRVLDALNIPQEEVDVYMNQGMQPLPGNANPQFKQEEMKKTQLTGAELAMANYR